MKKAIISRTIVNNVAHCLVFDSDSKSIHDSVVFVPASVNTVERVEKYIRKNNAVVGKLVSVEAVDRLESLVGMYLDTFMENATKVDERSKETRDSITKTVTVLECVALYMDSDRNVKEHKVIVPVGTTNIDGYVRKNCEFDGMFITVASSKEISELYAMDERKFIALAKPMKNKFQLDD